LVWPIALAYLAKLVIDFARRERLGAASLIVALLGVGWIYEGRDTTGRARWSHRYTELLYGIEYLHRVGDAAPAGGSYASVLAAIPAGATVAVWVARPELLDYRVHRIVDLRTPRWAPARKSGFARLVATTGADYLLVERDDASRERAEHDLIYRALCAADREGSLCGDELDAFVRERPILATDGLLRVVRIAPYNSVSP
jgi:hypothetical protein